MIGQIHSIESFGTVDGPGIRLVIFMKGCPMRCQYCHNPDTWELSGGTQMNVEEILNKYESSRVYYKNGGITLSGGEPLIQIDFVTQLFEEAKKRHIHTCLDTSGVTFQPKNREMMIKMDKLMAVTDLVLLDIKHIDPVCHQELCGQPNTNILAFAHYLDQLQIAVWLRHVVVPGITTDEGYLYRLGQFIGTLGNVKALDVLPYHDMGKIKYENLGIDYPLADLPALPKQDAIKARKTILKGIRDKRLEQQKTP